MESYFIWKLTPHVTGDHFVNTLQLEHSKWPVRRDGSYLTFLTWEIVTQIGNERTKLKWKKKKN